MIKNKFYGLILLSHVFYTIKSASPIETTNNNRQLKALTRQALAIKKALKNDPTNTLLLNELKAIRNQQTNLIKEIRSA